LRQIDQIHDAEGSVKLAASRKSSMPNCTPFRLEEIQHAIRQ
jgi:hypothetical protein